MAMAANGLHSKNEDDADTLSRSERTSTGRDSSNMGFNKPNQTPCTTDEAHTAKDSLDISMHELQFNIFTAV